jgi:hypothetical protein
MTHRRSDARGDGISWNWLRCVGGSPWWKPTLWRCGQRATSSPQRSSACRGITAGCRPAWATGCHLAIAPARPRASGDRGQGSYQQLRRISYAAVTSTQLSKARTMQRARGLEIPETRCRPMSTRSPACCKRIRSHAAADRRQSGWRWTDGGSAVPAGSTSSIRPAACRPADGRRLRQPARRRSHVTVCGVAPPHRQRRRRAD